TTAPGAKLESFTSSQWPLGPWGRRSTSLPPIVLIATSMRPSLPTSAAARPRPFNRSPPGPRIPPASPKRSGFPRAATRRSTRTGSAPLEAAPEPGGIGLRATGPGHVLVELIRVLVIRDVEIGATVVVVVQEHGAEPVPRRCGLEARLDPDLPESCMAARIVSFVEVE